MTSRDRQADRAAVFDRDGHACCHCGTGDDATPLRTYAVDGVSDAGDREQDRAHESALVTVCGDCYATLDAPPAADPIRDGELFRIVRETTRVQSATIADVASFASLATSLPTLDAEPADAVAESIAEYRRTRRDVSLALDIVTARLERLDAIEENAFDPEVRAALAAFAETAATLQSTLRKVVALGETVASGLDRCHGCFERLESDGESGGRRTACPVCGLAASETADWERDGIVAFDRLFATINETLQDAAATTETLTTQTTTLAEQLTAQ
ncbi:hypothetical protein [Natrinema salifodinae]|uniref:Uncharacterized protein n=1 Tax=Natrinema salifodinae TaxID=1202768 RepID=A0A1I0Q3K4_9EURY|nr:hypothetical protein [Natrinema salifodinae]SEW21551.1 hypothetical protein SAMN05216285_3033 [Natrinema salifodinae]